MNYAGVIHLPAETLALRAALLAACPDDCTGRLEHILTRHPPAAGKPARAGDWAGLCFLDGQIFIDPAQRNLLYIYLHEVAHALTPGHAHDQHFQRQAELLYSYFRVPEEVIDRDYDCHTAPPLAQRPERIFDRIKRSQWQAEKMRSENALDVGAIAAQQHAEDAAREADAVWWDALPAFIGVVLAGAALAIYYFRSDIAEAMPSREILGFGAFIACLAVAIWPRR